MKDTPDYKRTKRACFYTYVAMSSAFGLPPLLFAAFRDMYGISYTLLGTLVLVNFLTQLSIDLIFTFFHKKFNLKVTVRVMPLLTAAGLCVYALAPMFFPERAYIGLLTGTVLFSVSAGLSEVLLSPTVAALPSDNPERDMSALHSLYAYGLVGVILLSSLYLWLFGTENWMYLTLFWAALPLVSFVLFTISPMPEITMDEPASGEAVKKRNIGLMLCVICIFMGSAAENSMTNWISVYAESALGIPKLWGDILGMALFAILLGAGRSLYARFGKNISVVLLCGMGGAALFYIIAGLSVNSTVAMIACVLVGLCSSMLWPGTLILMEENLPRSGVGAYALLAAGGDFGAAIAPQLVGVIVDAVSASAVAETLSASLSLTAEQIGIKAGILSAAFFPLIGVAVLLIIRKYFRKKQDDPIIDIGAPK
ncbi:MAG: MFS transporter [Firmicutes bacterium]|uniref:MFS transporter n=1 Tax=Candidatus Stercoripulliclostridium pullicola TaxID=2840953 RepID=A0A940IDB2_9FIRM|nr:MFS transporter [Candidatus Stercoripulliclostridium pullicola]